MKIVAISTIKIKLIRSLELQLYTYNQNLATDTTRIVDIPHVQNQAKN